MYETFYNFSEPPFRLTPDPRFYYSSSTHMRALKHLRFGFHQREGFVVITGKPGTGKTELMLHLLENLPQDRISYGKIVTSNLDENEVLQQVAAAFKIPADGVRKGVLLKKLEDFFLEHVRDKKRLVLIVDEAHKLSINSLNELQMLTNFQLSGKSALQCFLSGHDNLKLKLNEPELLHLKQRVITSTFLTPLERNETQEYIEHRLSCVGWTGDPKFNQYAYSLIHETTEGIPRQINLLCNRVLLRALAEQKHYIDEGLVSRAVEDVNAEPLAEEQYLGDQPSIVIDSQSHNKTPAYPYNDQDETLPFPSVVNFSNSPNGNDAMVHISQWPENSHVGHGVGRSQVPFQEPAVKSQPLPSQTQAAEKINRRNSDFDQEIAAEAQKLSDALSDFHNDIGTLARPLDVNPRHIPNPGKGGVKPRNDLTLDSRPKPSTTTKPSKSVAPFMYGMTAFLLIAAGLSVWLYNFSNDVLEPAQVQAKNPTDDPLVATIKGLLPKASSDGADLPQESSVEDQAAGAVSNPDKTQTVMESQSASTVASESQPLITKDTESAETLLVPNENQSMDATVAQAKKAGGESPLEEKWDSGALGGNFLTQNDGENQQQNPTDKPDVPQSGVDDKNGKKVTQIAKADATANNINAQQNKTDQAPQNEQLQKKQFPKKKVSAVKVENSTTDANKAAVKASRTQNIALPGSSKPTKKSAAKPGKAKAKIAKNQASKSSKQTTDKANKDKLKTRTADPATAVQVAKSAGQIDTQSKSNTPAIAENDMVDAEQLNKLLKKLTAAYEKGNIKQLLSVMSNDVTGNDGSTREDLKNGYRKLFNITDMREMTITSVHWSKQDQKVHGEGNFQLRVREKGSDNITSYNGVISLEVGRGAEGAVITRLDYDYKQ